MNDRELDGLLDGAAGATLTLNTGQGIYFDRHELGHPHAWRAALRRQLGHTGYHPPVYGVEDHDQIIRVMFRLADAELGADAASR